MQNPCDFVIVGGKDGHSFDFKEARGYGYSDDKRRKHYITNHSSKQAIPILDDPASTTNLKCIVKLDTPWVVEADPNTVLLQCPVPYVNEPRFTAAMGIVDPLHTHNLNVQITWHNRGEEVLVEAGTPLCAYIPLDRSLLSISSFEEIIGPATDRITERTTAFNTMITSWMNERLPVNEKKLKVKKITEKYYAKR
jgi:hypothetical protein